MIRDFLDFQRRYWWVSALIIVAFYGALLWFASQEGARPDSPFEYRMD